MTSFPAAQFCLIVDIVDLPVLASMLAFGSTDDSLRNVFVMWLSLADLSCALE